MVRKEALEVIRFRKNHNMSKTYKHQDTYDYLHDNKELPKERKRKLLRYFDRINFWDWDLKIKYKKYKDFIRGGKSRIKPRKYKNR